MYESNEVTSLLVAEISAAKASSSSDNLVSNEVTVAPVAIVPNLVSTDVNLVSADPALVDKEETSVLVAEISEAKASSSLEILVVNEVTSAPVALISAVNAAETAASDVDTALINVSADPNLVSADVNLVSADPNLVSPEPNLVSTEAKPLTTSPSFTASTELM